MAELDSDHAVVKMHREWKKWEEIHSSGRAQYIRDAGEERHRSATGGSVKGFPEPASLAELQFWGEMMNAFKARFEDELRKYLAANPETTRASVERELDARVNA